MNLLPRTITTFQVLAIVCAGAFLAAVTFSMTFGMQTDDHGSMSGCPFTRSEARVCPMGVIEHIAKWQQLFTAAFAQSGSPASMVFLLLIFILLAVFARVPNSAPPALALSPPVPKHKPETALFNHLATAFSRGILNPRLYA